MFELSRYFRSIFRRLQVSPPYRLRSRCSTFLDFTLNFKSNFLIKIIFFLSNSAYLRFVFGNWLSQKSNNIAFFPLAFHITAQQHFKPLWSRLLLNDHEPSRALLVLCFKSLLMLLVPVSEKFVSEFLPLSISLPLVSTRLICPVWETLLVGKLPRLNSQGYWHSQACLSWQADVPLGSKNHR
jgi:hypothetical protein